MHHIIQANLFNEFGFHTLLDALHENEVHRSKGYSFRSHVGARG